MSPAKLSRVQQTEARQQKKQKRKAEEGKLHVKRQEMDKAKVSPFPLFAFFLEGQLLTSPQITDAVKRYSYLLGQTELFKHFVDIKVGRRATLGNCC